MLPKLANAIETLSALNPAPAPVDRAELVAHAWVAAYAAHWPDEAPAELRDLLGRLSWIRAAEPDRWLKQRRIALAQLARSDAGSA